MNADSWQFWVFFNLAVALLIILDIVFLHRKPHEVTRKEALLTSLFWVGLALSFNALIYWTRGFDDALLFLTGYIIEYSLSIDNLFVFVLIFSSLKVPKKQVFKVLFWGILGAIFMRAFFIYFGVQLIERFHFMIYVFGAFLVYTGIQFGLNKEKDDVENKEHFFISFCKRFFPVTDEYAGDHFFVKKAGKWFATPLFIALLTVEVTDVIFALDSIPAILGITTDMLIVYTSNIFAVLGLRSLYFALASMLGLFQYLHYGLAVILTFIGLKMLLSSFIHIPILLSLGFIFLCLATSIILSLIYNRDKKSS